MKKFKTMLAATAVVMAISAVAAPMSAFATDSEQKFNYSADTQTQTSDDVTVSYKNDPTYTVTIPADVSFTDTETEKLVDQTNEVNVNNVYLNKGKAVKVTVTSQNDYKMLLNGNDTSSHTL